MSCSISTHAEESRASSNYDLVQDTLHLCTTLGRVLGFCWTCLLRLSALELRQLAVDGSSQPHLLL